MAALHDELIIAVQSVRAFLIRKIWSTSSTETNDQAVDSFDIQSLHKLIQKDEAHSDIWRYFLSFYNLKSQRYFQHDEQKNIHTLVQYLRDVEHGEFPAIDLFSSIFEELKVEQDLTVDFSTPIEVNEKAETVNILTIDDSEESVASETNVIVISNEDNASKDDVNIADVDIKSLSVEPLQKIILEINNQGSLIESVAELIKPYQAVLQKIYQVSPDFSSAKNDHEKLITLIKIADYFIISDKTNNYHCSNDFEKDLTTKYNLLTLENYHNAILRLQSSTQKNAKFLKEVNDIANAAKSRLLISPNEQLQELFVVFSNKETEDNANKILSALDHTLTNTDFDISKLEGSAPVVDIKANSQIAQLKHPYYLEGSLEPKMKECPQYDDDLIQELKESFLEESETEIFPMIESTTGVLKTGNYEEAVILDLRRAFHTLKGSGYTASLPEIGEIGWQVERVINGVRDNYYPFSDAILYHALDGYQAISARIKDPNLQDDELQRITYQAQYLIDHGGIVDPADQLSSVATDESTIKIEALNFQSFEDIPTDFISPYRLYGQDKPSITETVEFTDDLVVELKSSMIEETQNELLPELNKLSSSLLSNKATKQELEKVRHIFHTLKGNSLLIGLNAFGEASGTAESILDAMVNNQFKLSPPIASHIADVYLIIKHAIEDKTSISHNEFQRLFYQGNRILENAGNITNLLTEQTQQKQQSSTGPSAEEALSVRRQAIFENIQSVIEQSELSSLDQKIDEKLDLTDEELSQQLIASFTKCENRTYSALKRYSQDVGLCLLHPNFSSENPIHHQLISAYHKHLLLFRAHGLTPYDERLILWGKILTSILAIIKTNQIDDVSTLEQIKLLQKPILDIEDKSVDDNTLEQSKEAQEEIDPEILQAFFEEAQDVLEHADEIIQSWQTENYNPNSELIAELRRQMHTLKGGARMVGKEGLGQLSHALESLLDPNYITLFDSDPKRFEVLQRALDHLQVLLENKNKQLDHEGFNLLSALHLLLGHENPPELTAQGETKDAQAPIEVTEKTATAAQSELSALKITPSQLSSISEKVSENNVLTTQYNNAVSDILSILTEISRTMQYLNMTARNIEIETEAQMISRHAKATENDEDFDPLELDQFSELQHLARAISESIEDLNAFHKNIGQNVESMGLSLSKFSGNQTLIADTLTDIGTVSFNTIVPRLRRIVRQVSKSNNKDVELITHGVDTQVERVVLEQMTAAFDHMIRNSIIHGIESPDKRLALGKSEHGTITLKVSKQGSDLAIEVSDDGKGFNVEKIRQKAINDGLISEDEAINDTDLVNLTMLPGFSTATHLSEDAGRGVGLDVLTKAMTILKGTAALTFVPNAGVAFKIYIPSTLMIMQSLIVNAGGQKYAIPVDNIIGVTQEKDVIFDGKRTHFVYHNEKYDVYDLDKFYSGVMVNSGKEQNYIYLLFEVEDQSIAVGAESITSQLEIIMHPLNPQIANIAGLTGSAVTPDGETIFTVDISAFANLSNNPVHKKEVASHEETHKTREDAGHKATVMVIDDSITMRRVSQRMLERAGYSVITAKDGIDALEVLENQNPDIIMLDIEMPRMDGFEVLTYLRSEDKFMKTPVMMVTSRSGEKHRNRAFEIGANEYCGKPYQEEQILQTIKKLLDESM